MTVLWIIIPVNAALRVCYMIFMINMSYNKSIDKKIIYWDVKKKRIN